ncbi:MAG: hypothetical protein MR989_06800, partial [Prevotella sp.]|nr:hypothetical protein [Prevotella sp.]
MNNQGLLALVQLILPSEILTNFEVVRVEEEASLIRIYLDESVKVLKFRILTSSRLSILSKCSQSLVILN